MPNESNVLYYYRWFGLIHGSFDGHRIFCVNQLRWYSRFLRLMILVIVVRQSVASLYSFDMLISFHSANVTFEHGRLFSALHMLFLVLCGLLSLGNMHHMIQLNRRPQLCRWLQIVRTVTPKVNRNQTLLVCIVLTYCAIGVTLFFIHFLNTFWAYRARITFFWASFTINYLNALVFFPVAFTMNALIIYVFVYLCTQFRGRIQAFHQQICALTSCTRRLNERSLCSLLIHFHRISVDVLVVDHFWSRLLGLAYVICGTMVVLLVVLVHFSARLEFQLVFSASIIVFYLLGMFLPLWFAGQIQSQVRQIVVALLEKLLCLASFFLSQHFIHQDGRAAFSVSSASNSSRYSFKLEVET